VAEMFHHSTVKSGENMSAAGYRLDADRSFAWRRRDSPLGRRCHSFNL